MNSVPADAWTSMWAEILNLAKSVGKVTAINVNSRQCRDAAIRISELYNRQVRIDLGRLEMAPETIAALDAPIARLNRLAHAANSKTSYEAVLGSLRKMKPSLDIEHDRLVGRALAKRENVPMSGLEDAIIATLDSLVPTAGLSYRQALQDITSSQRLSYRGPANDFREALREVLDHLAPDKVLLQSPGFKLEKDRSKPTMRQKALFILRSRGQPGNAQDSSTDALARIEASTADLARSVYNRGSISTHILTSYREVKELKGYVDAVLAELLEVHRAKS